MRGLGISLIVLPALLWAAASHAQEFEVGPSVGYTTSNAFDAVASSIDGAAIRGGFTWGGQVTRRFGRHWGAELSFTQQRTAFELEAGGRRADLFEIRIGQLQGSVVYEMRDSAAVVRPYLIGGAGVAFLSAQDLESETKFSWAIGGGVKAHLGSLLGVRLQARFLQTRLGGDVGDPACLPFGFCKPSLDQFELLAGLVLKL